MTAQDSEDRFADRADVWLPGNGAGSTAWHGEAGTPKQRGPLPVRRAGDPPHHGAPRRPGADRGRDGGGGRSIRRSWSDPIIHPKAGRRLREFVMLAVLALMALADGYGFWSTLTRLIQRDTYLVLVFVVAIAIGAVAVAHELGRLARSRWESYGGSVVWIGILAALWLSIGTTIAYLRARDPLISGPRGSGALAGQITGRGSDQGSLRIALLLLGLYLLTGVLAMTHAFQYTDPRSDDVRAAQRERERLVRLASEARYRAYLARQGLAIQKDLIDQQKAAKDRHVSEREAWADQLLADAVQQIAKVLGNPAATDGLTLSGWDPPPQPPPDRGRGTTSRPVSTTDDTPEH